MNEVVENGLLLLVIGMGFVLCFLTILIFTMSIMSKVVLWLNKLFPEVVEDIQAASKKAASNVDEAIAIAIAVIKARRS